MGKIADIELRLRKTPRSATILALRIQKLNHLDCGQSPRCASVVIRFPVVFAQDKVSKRLRTAALTKKAPAEAGAFTTNDGTGD